MSQQLFEEAYHLLNDRQKEAVDLIEGPVLVIAGPGTGKTEMLAIRVGHILKTTDTHAHNILCLTFTDAGAYAMRSRLLQYIGPEAYNVGIYTYHSFCNQVIQENIEYFGGYRDLQPVSDLEKVDIMRKIIDDLPADHILKRLKGDIYNDKYHLEKLFETMKKENWTEEDFRKGLEMQKELLKEDPEFQYKRKYTDRQTGKVYNPGDLKEKNYLREVEKYEKTYAASLMLKDYNRELQKLERFDFQDMILWVIDRFDAHDELLGKYQERYQYILLDEYQDTNGAQNKVVFQLADYWETPNLFAVGDDDQSIFRFQGANMSNVEEFRKKYDPEVIILNHNYRSDQSILDVATTVISYNGERMANKDDRFAKDLIEQRNRPPGPIPGPRIRRYRYPQNEEVGIIMEIEKLVSEGVEYRDIAVIYREHKEVNDLIKYLSAKGVPVNVKRRVDVLGIPIIRQIINILKYIEGELHLPHSEEGLLFEILHYSYFNIPPTDIAKISVYCSQKTDDISDDKWWREVIEDATLLERTGIRAPEAVLKASALVASWIKDALNETLQILVEKIVTSSGWLEMILTGPEKKWNLQVFNTFLNLIKEESARSAGYGLPEFIETLEKMEDNGIPCPVHQSIVSEDGINFVTAHSSKGLEFKHVFLIKVQKSTWVQKNINVRFKYPYTLVPVTEHSDIEDDRRLFFVAMTRAQDGLQISFSNYDHKEKESEAAVFVFETGLPVPDEAIDVDADLMAEYIKEVSTYITGSTELIDKDLLDEILKDFKLSATSLNKYLECPLAFYFEKILRVPMARTKHLGFGNAMHYALEHFFRLINENIPKGPVPPVERLISYFEKGMKHYHSHFTLQEFDNYTIHGTMALKDYYDQYKDTWLNVKGYKLEHVVDDVSYEGVPIKGKLDKLILRQDEIEVVDYKTGKYKAKNLDPPLNDDQPGGDYWRQIVFYKMLIDSDRKYPFRFGTGTMDFLEKTNTGRFVRKTLPVSALDEGIVRQQLTDTYQAIQDHKFEGCKEEDCKWCNFVSEMSGLTSPLSDLEYDGDE